MGVWLVVAAVAVIGEFFTLSFYLIYEALAAVVTAFAALVVPGLAPQVAIFVVASGLSLFVLRPATVNYVLRLKPRPTPAYPDLVGHHAVVRERVTGATGLVDLGGGEFWSARSLDPDRVFEPGAEVEVAFREGVRLVVDGASPAPIHGSSASPESNASSPSPI